VSRDIAHLHIGGHVWFCDVNIRRYPKDPTKYDSRGPHYRSSWRQVAISGETRVSWVLTSPVWIGGRTIDRIPKDVTKWDAARIEDVFAVTQQDVDDRCWIDANRLALVEAVRRCADIATLRAVQAAMALPDVPEIPLSEVH
jgi:hypothetical protein